MLGSADATLNEAICFLEQALDANLNERNPVSTITKLSKLSKLSIAVGELLSHL